MEGIRMMVTSINEMLMQIPKIDLNKDTNFIDTLVRFILENANKFQWTIRGSERVIRLDLNENICLHIWKPKLALDGVSIMHNHPWNLESMVVCGQLTNKRFVEVETIQCKKDSKYIANKINCGFDGGLVGNKRECILR